MDTGYYERFGAGLAKMSTSPVYAMVQDPVKAGEALMRLRKRQLEECKKMVADALQSMEPLLNKYAADEKDFIVHASNQALAGQVMLMDDNINAELELQHLDRTQRSNPTRRSSLRQNNTNVNNQSTCPPPG